MRCAYARVSLPSGSAWNAEADQSLEQPVKYNLTDMDLMSSEFSWVQLPERPIAFAPDGSEVRVLLTLAAGGMAHFSLRAGAVSRAMAHRTVEEIWYIESGRGEMWRRQGEREETIVLEPGICLTIPLGTHFQFRAAPTQAVAAIGVTMPPWPGEDEAYAVTGPWDATEPSRG
jgi:mannose-6-phosphate isomerase-like protein (cupin superfamily)